MILALENHQKKTIFLYEIMWFILEEKINKKQRFH